jgi:uncharacterized membrane protein YukC
MDKATNIVEHCIKCGAIVSRPGAMCMICRKKHDRIFYIAVGIIIILALISAIHLYDMLFVQRLFFIIS